MPIDLGTIRLPVGASRQKPLPWMASGELTVSTQVKASPGLLGGVVLTADDDAGNAIVVVWDSDNADLVTKEILCRVTITTLAASHQNSFSSPSPDGITVREGIYLQVVSGNCRANVYYK